jgi:hypothetical protein
MSGRPYNGSYSVGKEGGHLNSGYPIFLGSHTDNIGNVNGNNSDESLDRPQYSVFVLTPFSDILSNVDESVSKDRLRSIILLSVLSVGVALVFILFYRWYIFIRINNMCTSLVLYRRVSSNVQKIAGKGRSWGVNPKLYIDSLIISRLKWVQQKP